MACERLHRCPFFAKYKDDLGQQYQLLLRSYCHGILHETCKRLEHERRTGELAPVNLCPTGHRYKLKDNPDA
jgi:hypothetical protein